MPCYDSRNDSGPLLEKIDKLTRIACELARSLKSNDPEAITELSKESQNWIAQHQECDRRRGA